MSKGTLASLGGLVAAAVLGASLPVCAQPLLRNFTPFGDSHVPSNPPVARYTVAPGVAFTFDRSDDPSEALLKFDGNPEVWVLQPSPGPGGVTIYRNDVGDPVLRVTRLGGVTLFTPRTPEGIPAALMGDAEDLLPPPMIPLDSFAQRAAQGAYRASLAIQQSLGVQHAITFSTPNLVPMPWTPQFTDAFNVAADAIVRLGREHKAKAFLAKLDGVQFIAGQKPDVTVKGSMLMITLVPAKGFAGRPSSDRIIKAVPKK
jgi:hypothetical protein